MNCNCKVSFTLTVTFVDSASKWLEIAKVSRILVKVLKMLTVGSWVSPPVWNHVTKHFVTTVKSQYDEIRRQTCSIIAMASRNF